MALDLEIDGMKGPSEDVEEVTEMTNPETDTDEDAGSDGAMALEAIVQNDGTAFEEAVRRIANKK